MNEWGDECDTEMRRWTRYLEKKDKRKSSHEACWLYLSVLMDTFVHDEVSK